MTVAKGPKPPAPFPTMDTHDAIVSGVSARVKQFHARQEPFRIYHGSTNSTRRSTRRADNTVDTSKLDRVMSVDPETMTAVAEPNVPLGALVTRTLECGLMPPVVMEFPTITVGGGFSGTSGESSSFRYGAFDSTINWIEIVLPDGTVTRASQTERQDLFWGAASAFGTLGVVTLLEVQLIPARPYVQLTYTLSTSPMDMAKKLRHECDKEENDFVDGISFSKNSTVICTGRMVEELPEGQKSLAFCNRGDPWFYLRAQKAENLLREGKPAVVTDYIGLWQYLFRYDRGGFWTARYSYSYFLVPFNRITRYVLDRFMYTGVMYRALHKSGMTDSYILQDVGVPYDAVDEFSTWLDKELDIYPIWICPLRIQRDGGPSSAHGLHAAFATPGIPDLVNFGVWGPPSKGGRSRRAVVAKNRALEHKVAELGGKKWLYAQAFYTEDEFWAQYDRASYDRLRESYGAGYLPSVYDKVKVDVDAEEAAERATFGTRTKAAFWKVWPMRGLYGVYHALKGGDYLLQKNASGKTEGDAEKQV